MSIMNHEQENLWDSVQILASIDKEKAATVFKTTVEKSFRHLNLPSVFLSKIRLSAPTMDQVSEFRQLDRMIREAFERQEQDATFELVVDYIDKISTLSKEDSVITRKKLYASILAQNRRSSKKPYVTNERVSLYSAMEFSEDKKTYYTTMEVAGKLGLSDQTIRRMCDKGKFKGSYKTEGGHWRIPEKAFITSTEQDKKAREVFQKIDAKNQGAGDVNEFNL